MVFDSTAAALETQRAVWRRLGGPGRVRVAAQMSDDVRRIAAAGRRAREATTTRDQPAAYSRE